MWLGNRAKLTKHQSTCMTCNHAAVLKIRIRSDPDPILIYTGTVPGILLWGLTKMKPATIISLKACRIWTRIRNWRQSRICKIISFSQKSFQVHHNNAMPRHTAHAANLLCRYTVHCTGIRWGIYYEATSFTNTTPVDNWVPVSNSYSKRIMK